MSKVVVTDLNNTTELINSTVGKIGDAFDISGDFSNAQLKEAKVTIEYNADNLPEDVDPEDLMVMWYNEEAGKMVEMKSKVDVEDEVITFKTDHFSQYVIVSRSVWEEAWNKEVAKIREEDSVFSVEFIIDDSGSMASNDRENKRLDASKSAIRALSEKDRYLIMKFSSSSEVVQKFTEDTSKVDDALSKFKSSGDTNIVGAVKEGMNLFEEEKAKRNKIIILLTDGEDYSLGGNLESLVELANEENVTIFTIGLKPSDANLDFSVIKDLAEKTGGKFYEIDETNLSYIFLDITNAVVGVDGSLDSDNDGIPDGLEIAGIRTQFGQLISTSPYQKDSDGDGIDDNEEIGKSKKDKEGRIYYKIQDMPISKVGKLLPTMRKAGGPTGTIDVHDSGFRANVNGFSFKNFGTDANGGHCAGMAALTEKIYNGTIEEDEETLGNYLPKDYFKTLIYEKNIYDYQIKDSRFALPKEGESSSSPKISSIKEIEDEHDQEILAEIIVNYKEENHEYDSFGTQLKERAKYIFLKAKGSISEDVIEKLKDEFDKGKIISFHMRRHFDTIGHSINAYAIEKMDFSGNEYRLYVYDNNFPYNPNKVEDIMNGNLYITLKRFYIDGRYEYLFDYSPNGSDYLHFSSLKGLGLGAMAFSVDGEFID